MRIRCLFAVTFLSVLIPAACATEVENCPSIGGNFQPLYIHLNGSCGPIAKPFAVPFDGGISGVNTIIQRRVNGNITTEIVLKGCTVSMTQTVSGDEGGIDSIIDGKTLDIVADDEVAGQVAMTMYDDEGAIACESIYDARFTKDTAVVGGALGSN
ncbi:MAG: hypothetical protein OEZ06_30170 [Myxococcales bacterium]|nr:hypothetical protein [Myxococcales bacterium]